MELDLARMWWLVALRGVLAILFGLAAIFWPEITLLALVYLFAAYALVDGVFALVALVSGRGRPGQWWALLLEGILGIAFGVVTFVWPLAAVINLFVLVAFIAGWLIATGLFQVIAAIRLRRHIRGEWLLALAGVLSILLGIGFAIFPTAGLWVTALWIGAYSIVFGALLLGLGLRMHSLARHPGRAEAVRLP